jgi:hypothetical protein
VKGRACGRCGHPKFSWAFTVDVGKDGKGRRIQQKRSGFPSKADAERALHELPTFRIGRRLLVPTARLLDLLGLAADDGGEYDVQAQP